MSYDVMLQGWGITPVSLNMTSNVAPMWRLAGADIATFHGKSVRVCLPALRHAVEQMELHPEVYRPMNPSNGWGDYESCLGFLRDLITEFAKQPTARIYVDK